MFETAAEREPSRVFYPGKWPYIIFFVIFAPQVASFLALYVTRGDKGALSVAVVATFFLFYIWFWVFENQIQVSPLGVTHGWMPRFQKKLSFSEMKEYYFSFGYIDARGRKGPLIRLTIEPKPETGKTPIMISLKLFSSASCDAIIEILSAHIPEHTFE